MAVQVLTLKGGANELKASQEYFHERVFHINSDEAVILNLRPVTSKFREVSEHHVPSQSRG